MASPFPFRSTSNQNQKTPTSTICTPFLKDVCLNNWWLINVEMDSKGRRLGVAGFASREGQGIRLFYSAAIVKRHDTLTLEAVDGMMVTLSGFIDRSLTHQNGFPSEVCNHFLFGFPYYWEEFATQCFGEECTNNAVPSSVRSSDGFTMSSNKGSNSFHKSSFNDLPVTRIRDLLTSTLGASEHCGLTNNIFNDMLQKYSSDALKHNDAPAHSNNGSDCPLTTQDCVMDETLSNHKKTDAKIGEEEEFPKVVCQSKINNLSSSKGVATRSMTRLSNIRNEQEGNLSSHFSVKRGRSESISASNSGKQKQGMVTKRSAPNKMHATILSVIEMEVKESHDISKSGRSSKLTSQSDLFSTVEALPLSGGMTTRKTGSNAHHTDEVSRKEIQVKDSPCESAVRRSTRQRNLMK